MEEERGSRDAVQIDSGTRDFLLAEFKALRDEILGSMERLVRIQLLGITAIPLVMAAGDKYNLTIVIAAAPLVTIVFVFILLYEQSNVMRVGRYIREVIEPRLAPGLGWEAWLENPKDEEKVNRLPESFFARATYAAFTVYYIGGMLFTHKTIEEELTRTTALIIDAFYVGLFLYGLWFIYLNFAANTVDLPSHRLVSLKRIFRSRSGKPQGITHEITARTSGRDQQRSR